MIAIPNFNPKDGLYQIDKGRIHKYKAKGGTVRVYDLIDIVRCGDCKHSKEWYGDRRLCYLWAEVGVSVFEGGYCNYGERRTETLDERIKRGLKEWRDER